jgi:hypothetical protein
MGDREDRARVFIQLSESQVDRVIATASFNGVGGVGGGEAADAGRKDAGRNGGARARASGPDQWIFRSIMEDRTLSHSLLLGLEVLTCFPLDGTERGVADIARQLRMNNSTVHRYMTTLMRVGLLERNPDTRWYRLRNGGLAGDAD